MCDYYFKLKIPHSGFYFFVSNNQDRILFELIARCGNVRDFNYIFKRLKVFVFPNGKGWNCNTVILEHFVVDTGSSFQDFVQQAIFTEAFSNFQSKQINLSVFIHSLPPYKESELVMQTFLSHESNRPVSAFLFFLTPAQLFNDVFVIDFIGVQEPESGMNVSEVPWGCAFVFADSSQLFGRKIKLRENLSRRISTPSSFNALNSTMMRKRLCIALSMIQRKMVVQITMPP